jgi:hypothetical protein
MAQNIANSAIIRKERFGLGLNISTNGVGAQLAYSILKNNDLIARVEGRYFYSEIKDREITFQQTPMLVNGYIKRGSIGFMLDYHPFGNSFKLTTGFAILLNEVNNVAKYKDSSVQGGIKISPDEMGTIIIGYNIKPSPYLGFGIGKSVPNKRVGFSFEIGFYYTGMPNMTYKSTGLIEPSQNYLKNVNYPVFVDDWYNDYGKNAIHDAIPIVPVITCGLNVRLGKK